MATGDREDAGSRMAAPCGQEPACWCCILPCPSSIAPGGFFFKFNLKSHSGKCKGLFWLWIHGNWNPKDKSVILLRALSWVLCKAVTSWVCPDITSFRTPGFTGDQSILSSILERCRAHPGQGRLRGDFSPGFGQQYGKTTTNLWSHQDRHQDRHLHEGLSYPDSTASKPPCSAKVAHGWWM